ncbi:MAG TPA: SPFH domain-containing protein [Myxococcaceae bacterium]|jgi:regulator of protease activity HflC (stomatin/prohibitin superfamily)|nr:SPFH domain-containing protein [Myxococcaceae bacterium]
MPRLAVLLVVAGIVAGAVACSTVPAGYGGVAFGPSGVDPSPVREGVTGTPWFGEVTLYDLRLQSLTVRFSTLSADGIAVTTSASVVTFRVVPAELVALSREVGPRYAEVILRPSVEAAVRQVLGSLHADELDSAHLVAAQQAITERAAADVRRYHVLLESVDLRTVQVEAPLALAQVGEALALEQVVLAGPHLLEISAQRAEARRSEAEGIASRDRTLVLTLTPEVLENLRNRAWSQLLRAPASSVVARSPGQTMLLEVKP